MTFVRATKEGVIFNVNTAEQPLFCEILGLYPVVPAAHQPLSRSLEGPTARDDQKLLDEALAEQRTAHRQRIQVWLKAGNRFRPVTTGFNFTLRHAEAEWLLQVLNDIRVGSWLLLGSPDERLDPDELKPPDPELHRLWAIMELSGMFQMAILHGLEGQESPGT